MVADWNAQHPVGTAVKYFSVANAPEFRLTTTTTPAWWMGGHSAMVTVAGVSGGVSLNHLVLV